MDTETTPAFNPSALTEKTVFFILEFGRFGNTRTVDIEANTTAKQNRFGHSKRLLDSPELAEIAKQDAALRVWIDQPTRCWKYGKTMRVVVLERVDEIVKKCREYQKVERPLLVKAFLAVYLEQIAAAQKDLGPQFNPTDYLSLEEVEKEFTMSYSFPTFATDEKLKTISPELYAMEAGKEQGNLVVLAEEMRAGMRVLLKEYVDKLLETLKPTDGKKKKLHSSAVTKLQDFLSTFNLNNATSDNELGVEVDKLKLIMSGVDADKIKESDTLKSDLVTKFAEVSGNMANLVEVKGRKFR